LIHTSGINCDIVGPLNDQYGRKRIIIIGHILALIGPIIGLIGQQVYVIMIGLIITGLGLGGQNQAVAVLSEIVKAKNRGGSKVSISLF
jgi:MFS family permease